MHFQSGFAANSLKRLERITDHLNGRGPAIKSIVHSMSVIDSILADLGRQVVDNDYLGVHVGCEEELVFRTARLIIDTQLDRLDQAIRCIVTAGHHSGEVAGWRRVPRNDSAHENRACSHHSHLVVVPEN